MVALRELAKQIETQQEADSKAVDMKGKNVRGPSLISDQFYLGKSWKPTNDGSDNRYLALRFKGSARKDKDGQRTMFAENPRLIDLKPGDVYIFEIAGVTQQTKPEKPTARKSAAKAPSTRKASSRKRAMAAGQADDNTADSTEDADAVAENDQDEKSDDEASDKETTRAASSSDDADDVNDSKQAAREEDDAEEAEGDDNRVKEEEHAGTAEPAHHR